MGDDTAFAHGFHQLENLSFVPLSTSVSTEPFILLFPSKSTPCTLVFFTASSYPILSWFTLCLYLIPSPCNTRSSSSLCSGPKPHSWSGTHPLFLHFSTQPQFSCSLNSTQTGLYFSHHLDGSRRIRNNSISVQLCCNINLTLAKSSQNTWELRLFVKEGQFLAGTAKDHGKCWISVPRHRSATDSQWIWYMIFNITKRMHLPLPLFWERFENIETVSTTKIQ